MDFVGTNQCSCNLTSFLDELKFDDVLRDKLRGPQGPHGKEGKTGSPGLTVSGDLFQLHRSPRLTGFCFSLEHRAQLESLANADLPVRRGTVEIAVTQAPQGQRECRAKRGSQDWMGYREFRAPLVPLERQEYRRTMR